MRIKIAIIIIMLSFIILSVVGQDVAEPLTDNPNIFMPIYKEVDKSTHQGEYYNFEYMMPEDRDKIIGKKIEEIRSILHGTYGKTGEATGTPAPTTIQQGTQGITLPALDQNLNEPDRINIYLFFDIEQTWEKYIETRLFYEPLSSHFDIIANWRDGRKAMDSYYQGVLQQRDSVGLTINDEDSRFQTRLASREAARNNMINWLKLKEERVLEEVGDYIKDKSGNDSKGTTKVIGRLRKPTPYETVLGEPVPTEKTELIKE